MRKAAIVLTLMALLVTGATAFLVELGSANPYIRDYVASDAFTKPPEISIYSPQNNTSSSKVYLSINVSLPKSTTATFSFLHNVYFRADWLVNQTYLYNSKGLSDEIRSDNSPERQYFSYSGALDEVPEGFHSLTIYAEGGGWYPPKGIMQSGFFIDGNSTVFFTVDNIPPRITLLSVENKTYYTAKDTSDLELTVLTNEPVARTSYSLDGKTNTTMTGNATLTGLSVGEHNLTVYSWDSAGNIGASETVTFNISNPEPFPTATVVAASAVAAVVVAGLLVYHKKHKTKAT